jgi:hypothetical protein
MSLRERERERERMDKVGGGEREVLLNNQEVNEGR